MPDSTHPIRLNPTSLAQYIRFENCDRFLRFRLVEQDAERMLQKWNLTIQPLTPLLKESGADFESDVASRIAGDGETVIDLTDAPVADSIAALQSVRTPTIFLQLALEAPIGDFWCSGRADAIRVSRDRRGRLEVLVADIKARRMEKVEHRVQVTVYARMLEWLANEHEIPLASIRGTILTMPDSGILPALTADTPTFDLDTYGTILNRLAVEPDSVAKRILEQPFKDAFYHLSYKCDGCMFNTICMHDSAERLDVALVPYITPVEKRVLNEAGVQRLPQLVELMNLPQGNDKQLIPNPAQQPTLEILQNRWPVAPNLPTLVQRARAALHNFNATIDSRSYLLGSGFGTLPSEVDNPDLVKIFFDAQHDYLRGRIYLISALVTGPQGKRLVVKRTNEPPTDEIEGQLLVAWVKDVITAARQVTRRDEAPVHLYCYNRYDQRVLLEALKRHLEEVASLPAFFDLMTQSPALNQPMISFLSDEIRERKNLGLVCSPLHDTARRMGFRWQDENYNYARLFWSKMFDNVLPVLRNPDGTLQPLRGDVAKDDPRRLRIEVNSRFTSQIPLEYAYAVWGCLPETSESNRLLEPFRRVTLDSLTGFAGMRVKALAHIEASFQQKARFVDKKPLNLRVLQAEADQGLVRALEEFLYMEHHASLQANLLSYSLTVDRRVQSGMAMLLCYLGKGNGHYLFKPEFTRLGLDPKLTMNACKLKEDDWVVFNPTNQPLSPNQMKHGRLARVVQVREDYVALELLEMTFGNGFFRYYHKRDLEPQAGQFYTIDPMADDLNADKMLSSLKNVQENIFYEWLNRRPDSRFVPQTVQETFAAFANQVEVIMANQKRRMTVRQREAVAGNLGEPLVLVQGPPGTGKSYTLAWAILAQIVASSVQNRPCRVAISCKTHNAITVELKALADALRQIVGFASSRLGAEALKVLQIYKVVNDGSDPVPAGVQALDPYKSKGILENLLKQSYYVVGATSGGLFNLMRYRPLGGKEVDWSTKTFDLVVIDEASQMSLPEGVLAGAFLKPEGKMIVVGDHRQMPPIIAHAWKDEQKRSVTKSRPFISLFESLMERKFPYVALDESFRLHAEIAEFLRENVYNRDGIAFHSRRKELINQLPKVDPYVDAVLNPQHPIVVIEHSEHSSQQSNQLEIELAEPLIDACVRYLSLDGKNGIGVVVPHRAQKALLRAKFPELAEVNSIDTVERFQGDERDVIIVSATASDPDYVRSEAEFLLNINRLNVAISRPKKKLIVIASQSVVDLLCSDLEIFENAVIWKRLYHHYTPEVLYRWQKNGTVADVRGRRAN